jgi:hypothetical protein
MSSAVDTSSSTNIRQRVVNLVSGFANGFNGVPGQVAVGEAGEEVEPTEAQPQNNVGERLDDLQCLAKFENSDLLG